MCQKEGGLDCGGREGGRKRRGVERGDVFDDS